MGILDDIADELHYQAREKQNDEREAEAKAAREKLLAEAAAAREEATTAAAQRAVLEAKIGKAGRAKHAEQIELVARARAARKAREMTPADRSWAAELLASGGRK
jgi:hypothetical protein